MIRLTEEEYALIEQRRNAGNDRSKKPKPKNTKRIVAGGYTSNWQGWATVGDQKCYFRSLWEHNYACFLEWQCSEKRLLSWEHEPKRFSFKDKYLRPPYDYLPDFKVTYSTGVWEWHEVKGFLNGKSKSKIKRFEKHFPREGAITLIDKRWFSNTGNYSLVIPGWLSLQAAQHKYPSKPSA